jgi:hypothetical protein
MNNNNTKTSQVITFRIAPEIWNRFEIDCIENNTTMSHILRQAVNSYVALNLSDE